MKNILGTILTILAQILMCIGAPLGFIVWQIRKLFVKQEDEDFLGLAQVLETFLICGIITVIGVVLLILLL